jgi:hypothetical protein
MVRHRLVTFSGWIFFCSKKCKDEYRKHCQLEVRKRKFRELLHTLANRFSINRYARIHEALARGAGRLVAPGQRLCRSGE